MKHKAYKTVFTKQLNQLKFSRKKYKSKKYKSYTTWIVFLHEEIFPLSCQNLLVKHFLL